MLLLLPSWSDKIFVNLQHGVYQFLLQVVRMLMVEPNHIRFVVFWRLELCQNLKEDIIPGD